MRALVIGASGLIGGAVSSALEVRGHHVEGTYRHVRIPAGRVLEIADYDGVARMLDRVNPQVVVLAAGPSPEAVQADPARARMHLVGLRTAIRALHGYPALVVMFSSDHVFDGTCGPYLEDEPTWPATDLGRMHQAAELMLAEELRSTLVVRTSGVFGWPASGVAPLVAIRRRLALGRSIMAAYDRVITPTYVGNLAAAVAHLAEAEVTGVAHVAGPMIEESQFLIALARAFALNPHLIQPVSYAALADPGMQPAHGGLVSARAMDVIPAGVLMRPEEALGAFALAEPGADAPGDGQVPPDDDADLAALRAARRTTV